jgi:hypothetical protein
MAGLPKFDKKDRIAMALSKGASGFLFTASQTKSS